MKREAVLRYLRRHGWFLKREGRDVRIAGRILLASLFQREMRSEGEAPEFMALTPSAITT